MEIRCERNSGRRSVRRNPLEPESFVSRRRMLAGTVATTAAAAVAPIAGAALCGWTRRELATGYDGIPAAFGRARWGSRGELSRRNLARTSRRIFWIKILASIQSMSRTTTSDGSTPTRTTSSFGKLLQIAKDNRQSGINIIAAVNASDDASKFLARSIVLLWYLGSWYEPADLKANAATPGTRAALRQSSSRRRHTLKDWSGRSLEPIRWATAICSSVIGRAIRTIRTMQCKTRISASSPQQFLERKR